MITEAILSLFGGFVVGVLDLLPEMDVPGWFGTIGDKLTSTFAFAGGMGAWIPLSLAGQVFAFVLVCVGIGFVIKLVRIVVSFLTAGGGSAG